MNLTLRRLTILLSSLDGTTLNRKLTKEGPLVELEETPLSRQFDLTFPLSVLREDKNSTEIEQREQKKKEIVHP
jgi:hypothetical protein